MKSVIDRATDLNNALGKDTVVLEPRAFLDDAVVRYRKTAQGYHLVYGYDELVHAFMRQGMDEEEAVEWISYNTERSLSYMESSGVPPKIAYPRYR